MNLSFQDHFICGNIPATEGFNDNIALNEGFLYRTVSVIQWRQQLTPSRTLQHIKQLLVF